jgi:hypothetical protein
MGTTLPFYFDRPVIAFGKQSWVSAPQLQQAVRYEQLLATILPVCRKIAERGAGNLVE